MRAFALALILANLFFFGWSRLVASDSDRDVPVIKAGPRVTLASEMTLPPAPAVKPTEPRVAANTESPEQPRQSPTVESTCRSVGPFAELTEASRASVALYAVGLEPRQRIVQGEFWVGYGVNIPNLGGRENAERALETVQSRGIADAYIFPTATTSNAISVGVFPEYANAQARVEELRQLGFQPEILDRKRTEPLYWIDVDLRSPDQSLDEVLVQMDPGKINRIETRTCPPAAAPTEATG